MQKNQVKIAWHTSDLEAFNSMQLKYVPKRTAFQYLGLTCCTMLAAIDHNIHSFRGPACTKDGRQIFKRKHSKRTKKWHAEVVKTPKDYFHIPILIAKILKHRKEDKKPATRHFKILERDPKRTHPVIAFGQTTTSTALLEEEFKSKGHSYHFYHIGVHVLSTPV